MAGLPHYSSSKASVNKFEPVFLNQFEVTITPPAAIPVITGNPGSGNILLEHVTRVSGLQVDQNPGEITQAYKFAKRYYSGAAPRTTGLDADIEFEVNLDDNNSMYVFKTLRQWSDLVYNPVTGAMGIKRDYAGNILINVFNRQGDVHRRINLRDCFPMTPITDMALNYTQTAIYKLNITWAVDYFEDVFI
jgi:hypothetical protein